MIRPSDPNLPNPWELEEDVTEYVQMRVDGLKLSIVDHLSSLFGNGIALTIAIVICSVALSLFSVVFVLLLSAWLGSLLLGALILGCIYVIAAMVVWIMRKKIVDVMVGVFARMMFSTSKEDEHELAGK